MVLLYNSKAFSLFYVVVFFICLHSNHCYEASSLVAQRLLTLSTPP